MSSQLVFVFYSFSQIVHVDYGHSLALHVSEVFKTQRSNQKENLEMYL